MSFALMSRRATRDLVLVLLGVAFVYGAPLLARHPHAATVKGVLVLGSKAALICCVLTALFMLVARLFGGADKIWAKRFQLLGMVLLLGGAFSYALYYKTTAANDRTAKALISAMDEQGKINFDPARNYGKMTALLRLMHTYSVQVDGLMQTYQKQPFLAAMAELVKPENMADPVKRATLRKQMDAGKDIIIATNKQAQAIMDSFGKDLQTQAAAAIDDAGGWADVQTGIAKNKMFFARFFALQADGITTLDKLDDLLSKTNPPLKKGKFTFKEDADQKAFNKLLGNLLLDSMQQQQLAQGLANETKHHMDTLKQEADHAQ